MKKISEKQHLIEMLKILLEIDDIEIIKYTLESIIEDLEDSKKKY